MDKELYKNILEGNVQEVHRLIEQNKSLLQKRWEDGATLLHVAAEKNHDHLITLLVETYHMDVNACDTNGCTPLSDASALGCLRSVCALLKQKDIDIEKKDKEGMTPLHKAAFYDCREVMLLLLSAGSNCNATDFNDWTPLHAACFSDAGNLEIVKILLQQKSIQIDATNKKKRTPLHFASGKGHTEVVFLLLSAGSNFNATNINGWTPLHEACFSDTGNLEIVKILLQQKAIQIDATNKQQRTPLHLASHKAHESIVRCLLEAGADMDTQDLYGNTPLHRSSHKPIVRCLLEAGADPTSRDNEGNIPLDLLQQPQDRELRDLLTPVPGMDYSYLPKAAIRNP